MPVTQSINVGAALANLAYGAVGTTEILGHTTDGGSSWVQYSPGNTISNSAQLYFYNGSNWANAGKSGQTWVCVSGALQINGSTANYLMKRTA
jgi:hypothetical protein